VCLQPLGVTVDDQAIALGSSGPRSDDMLDERI
jgi:hypothetical protein